jgi:hypothetical protein
VQVTWLEDGLQRQRSACSLMTVISTRKHTWTLNKPALGARWCFAWMGGRAAGYGEAATDCVSRVGLRVCCARCNGVGPGVGVVSVSRDGGSRLLLPFRYTFVLSSGSRAGCAGRMNCRLDVAAESLGGERAHQDLRARHLRHRRNRLESAPSVQGVIGSLAR